MLHSLGLIALFGMNAIHLGGIIEIQQLYESDGLELIFASPFAN